MNRKDIWAHTSRANTHSALQRGALELLIQHVLDDHFSSAGAGRVSSATRRGHL